MQEVLNTLERHTVCTGTQCFESEEDASKGKNAKRAIVLKECRAFRIVQYRERNFCLAFELNGGSETFLVSCKTTEEAEAWLEQCNLYLKDL